MRKILNDVVMAVITIGRESSERIPRGKSLFRPAYSGTVKFIDVKETKEMLCRNTGINGGMTNYVFRYAEGNKWLEGRFSVNMDTGLTRIHAGKNVLDIKEYFDVEARCRAFIFNAVIAMARMSFQSWVSQPKAVLQAPAQGKVITVMKRTADTIPFTPAEITSEPDAPAITEVEIPFTELPDAEPAPIIDELPEVIDTAQHEATPRTVFAPEGAVKTMEVTCLSWPRRGAWVTKKDGTKFWRRGSVCHRHI